MCSVRVRTSIKPQHFDSLLINNFTLYDDSLGILITAVLPIPSPLLSSDGISDTICHLLDPQEYKKDPPLAAVLNVFDCLVMLLRFVWPFPWLLSTVNTLPYYSVYKDGNRDLMYLILLAIWSGFGKNPVSLKHIFQIASFRSFGQLPLSLFGTNPK